ncbi:hypothetical protein MAPG_11365 [Magnaporthiopsis poae ATCC 64411]|uniref:Uncharacterized protein n=1 Tax=Magnaporthiopsis poae (strain ATCC 64411 / 73-15) TaxID=644358 RepID=A0A0C4EF30_MAGP6|nr:hypothetical protein MAPG_11365 [Magnaporthiopsis poae ATCC 64411]
MASVSWDPVRSWVDWAAEDRGEAHTFLAEGTGHGNFTAYHERFGHPWKPHHNCGPSTLDQKATAGTPAGKSRSG